MSRVDRAAGWGCGAKPVAETTTMCKSVLSLRWETPSTWFVATRGRVMDGSPGAVFQSRVDPADDQDHRIGQVELSPLRQAAPSARTI